MKRTTVSFDALRVFQAVAEAQGFTRAAVKLGLDKAAVSRTVRALEASMQAALLVRSTRSVRLTPEGEALFRRVAPLLAGLEVAVTQVPERAAIPSGEVVLTTTPDLGRALVAPALASFRRRFPGVTVTVHLAHDVVDLMREGVDLALRVGRPGPGSAIARKVGELQAGFYASPEYLARRGVPESLEALAGHDGLWPSPPRGQKAFGVGAPPPSASVRCGDFGFLLELAKAGGGVALLPAFLAAREVAAGALARVLPATSLGGAPLYLVSRPLKPLPARVVALRQHLLEALAGA